MITKTLNRNFTKGVKQQLINRFYNYDTVSKRGYFLLQDPTMNKTCAFSPYEKDHLRVRGFVPNKILTLEQQAQHVMDEYDFGLLQLATMYPDPETTEIGVTPDMIRKNRVLQTLQDLDVTLYYNLIQSNFREFLPIVLTPTVAWVCKNFSQLFRRARGCYISLEDKGHVAQIFASVPLEHIRVITITDGSKILSIGDWGVGAMPIVVGRKDTYVTAGGFNPWRVLPLVIDVGTDNKELQKDSKYLGLQRPRAQGKEYYELMDEVMDNIRVFYPHCMTVFEDFKVELGLDLIFRYREKQLVFNECISGTASTILAGVLSGLKIQNKPYSDITKLKFFIVGAGNVGMGIVYNLCLLLQKYGLDRQQACKLFYLFDQDGFITTKRQNVRSRILEFASFDEAREGHSLEQVIKEEQPHVLVGCSGQRGVFTEQILQNLSNKEDFIPLIFALSNPTSKSECTAKQAFDFTGNNVIFTSGSPFQDVEVNGKIYTANQAHNSYIGPGLARGCTMCQISKSDDDLIISAAEGLADLITPECAEKRSIYPEINDLCDVSDHVAAFVVMKAHEKGIIKNSRIIEFFQKTRSFDEVKTLVREGRWVPEYRMLINQE